MNKLLQFHAELKIAVHNKTGFDPNHDKTFSQHSIEYKLKGNPCEPITKFGQFCN